MEIEVDIALLYIEKTPELIFSPKDVEAAMIFDPNKGVENAVIDEELALKWLNSGATPSDTVKAMFNRKGILAKYASSKVVPSKKEEKPAKKAPAKKATKKAE